MLSKIASWAMRELIARMECLVSSDFVKSAMSEASTSGDVPKFVTQIVVAPQAWLSLMASTMSLDAPECEIPMATLPRFRCEAMMACIWLSQQACAESPRRRNLCAASCAIAAELPSPKITMRSALLITCDARSIASASSTVSVLERELEMSTIRFLKISKQLSPFSISALMAEEAFSSAAIQSFSSWYPTRPSRLEKRTTVASPQPHFSASSEIEISMISPVCCKR